MIRADERKVRQVVYNLLSNAIKFTPPEGRVDVSAQLRTDPSRWRSGTPDRAFPTQDLERIFEEFQQAGDGHEHEGTGLGLPLSRKFVELHGGRLWVESAVGAGSTFRFTLPVEPGGIAVADELILIVDDNAHNVKLARDVLRFAGFRTLEAAAGAKESRSPASTSRISCSWTSAWVAWTGWRRFAC